MEHRKRFVEVGLSDTFINQKRMQGEMSFNTQALCIFYIIIYNWTVEALQPDQWCSVAYLAHNH